MSTDTTSSPNSQTPSVHFQIGGKVYHLPPMNLRVLKVAWPAISKLNRVSSQQTPLQDAMVDGDPDASVKMMELHAERVSLIADVMFASLWTVDRTRTRTEFEEDMTYEESVQMLAAFNTLLIISGLDKSGEVEPSAGAASLDSTAIGTGSSLN